MRGTDEAQQMRCIRGSPSAMGKNEVIRGLLGLDTQATISEMNERMEPVQGLGEARHETGAPVMPRNVREFMQKDLTTTRESPAREARRHEDGWPERAERHRHVHFVALEQQGPRVAVDLRDRRRYQATRFVF